jgi:streptogramin lyase
MSRSPGVLAGLVATAVLAIAAPVTAATPTITEFSAGLNPGSTPDEIAAGPDGNLWFSDVGTTDALGRITPAGQITELNLGVSPKGVAGGPDGNVWFTIPAGIGRVTPAGTFVEFSAGLNPGSQPNRIAAGPDGNLWFTDGGTTPAIGRITPAGTITEFSLHPGAQPLWIAAGPDGNLWFSASSDIGRVTPAGVITEPAATGLNPGSAPGGLTAGPDGNLWFADGSSTPAIGRVTPAGMITEFSTGLTPVQDNPYVIAAGADGHLWFTDSTCPGAGIGRVSTAGEITLFTAGLPADSCPYGIAAGPDGNLWFADETTSGAIGRVTTPPAAATGAAAVLGSAAAKVAGTVNGHAQQTSYRFEFGTSAAYGSAAAATDAGSGFSDVAAAATLSGLSPGSTYHYRLDATNPTDTTSGADAAFTTPPLPKVSSLHVANRIWREGSKLPQISRRRSRPPVGTRITFSLNRDAGVQLRFLAVKPGRKVHGKCRAPTRKTRRGKRCKRLVSTGKQISYGAHTGSNAVRFQGRISKSSRLKPGSYKLRLIAKDPTTPQTSSATASFKIVRH